MQSTAERALAPTKAGSDSTSRAWCDLLAPSLILLTPFLNYLFAHDYDPLAAESLLIVGALAVAGLICSALMRIGRIWKLATYAVILSLFVNFSGGYGFFEWTIVAGVLLWVLRRYASEILAVTFSALFIVSIVVPPTNLHQPRTTRADVVVDDTLPPVVHVVLDEHLGPGGLDTVVGGAEVADELRRFYVSRGFALAEGAYSQYFKTNDSLPNLFNFASNDHNLAFFPPENATDSYVLRDNTYFSLLAERGYVFRVYQSEYMDFCNVARTQVSSCLVYRNSIKAIETLPLTLPQRTLFVLNSYLHVSGTARQIRRYYRGLRQSLEDRGMTLPVWHDSYRAGALAIPPVLEQLHADIDESARGYVFFVHLMLPHYPYVFTDDCQVSANVSHWFTRESKTARKPFINTDRSRKERYALYLAQMKCQQRLLGELFDHLAEDSRFDDATVLVHGDHGSRISLLDPLARHAEQLSEQDVVDHYSTLWAVKQPGRQAGASTEANALQNLLADAFEHPAPVTEDFVYLYDSKRGEMPRFYIGGTAAFRVDH